MQSIYGFRDADVGLFIKAKQLGFDNLALEPLVLRTNFRSSAGLVAWVNRVFGNAFPAADDIRRGEIVSGCGQRSGMDRRANFPPARRSRLRKYRCTGATQGRPDGVGTRVEEPGDQLASPGN